MLEILRAEREKDYFKELTAFLKEEYANCKVFPPKNEIFTAFKLTPYEKVKVVILGQDPYFGEGQAHGLSFSVKPDVPMPKSLINIFKELSSDCGCYYPNHGCLEKWAKQGVLMLNTVLTVRAGVPNSHKNMGWERFTDEAIIILNNKKKKDVFII